MLGKCLFNNYSNNDSVARLNKADSFFIIIPSLIWIRIETYDTDWDTLPSVSYHLSFSSPGKFLKLGERNHGNCEKCSYYGPSNFIFGIRSLLRETSSTQVRKSFKIFMFER